MSRLAPDTGRGYPRLMPAADQDSVKQRTSDPSDPYRWLEDPDSPETVAWVAEQNRRSEAFLSAIPERAVIRDRLTTLWNYERCSPPSKHGDWFVFSKNSGLQPQAVLFRSRTLDGPAEVLLDPNTLSDDGTMALTATSVSEDGRWLAYALSESGSDWMTWRVRDVRSEEHTSELQSQSNLVCRLLLEKK